MQIDLQIRYRCVDGLVGLDGLDGSICRYADRFADRCVDGLVGLDGLDRSDGSDGSDRLVYVCFLILYLTSSHLHHPLTLLHHTITFMTPFLSGLKSLLYMHAHVYIHAHTCIHACTHMHTHVCICTQTCA